MKKLIMVLLILLLAVPVGAFELDGYYYAIAPTSFTCGAYVTGSAIDMRGVYGSLAYEISLTQNISATMKFIGEVSEGKSGPWYQFGDDSTDAVIITGSGVSGALADGRICWYNNSKPIPHFPFFRLRMQPNVSGGHATTGTVYVKWFQYHP